MSDTKAYIYALTAAWSSNGWSDTQGATLLAAQLLADGGSTPLAIAKRLPAGFYAANQLSRQQVANSIAALPVVAKHAASNDTPIHLLFVAAGPSTLAPLRLGAEQRDIMEGLRSTSLRERFSMDQVPAARSKDLINALNRYDPTILHISGHGNEDVIVFEAEDGSSAVVDGDLLKRIIMLSGSRLKLVVLSACESAKQAKALISHVDAAIGMKTSIGDEAARTFAVQLYKSLGEGVDLKRAFEQAALQIDVQGLQQGSTPVLYTKKGVNPAKVYF